jgi:hypothetical protein
MTPEQALQNLYTATRIAPLTAEQHDILRQSAQVLQKFIEEKKQKEEKKK